MTTKILNGPYASAYLLQAPITTLIISANGSVAGNADYGVYAKPTAQAAYTVANRGTVTGGGVGVSLTDGGRVTNGTLAGTAALIEGETGVQIGGAAGKVINLSTIQSAGASPVAAIHLASGGAVINGAASVTTALLYGYGDGVVVDAGGTVTNFAIVHSGGGAKSGDGVLLSGGGLLINGSANDTVASIYGYAAGVGLAGAGTVSNFGTILGTGVYAGDTVAKSDAGVSLGAGGSVTNGTIGSTDALIEGQTGISVTGAAGTVKNFGTVSSSGDNAQNAITLYDGGSLTNGAATDTTATLYGYRVGVLGLDATVTNFGTIRGGGGSNPAVAIDMVSGGRLTNGTNSDTAALVSGQTAVLAIGVETISNFATLDGSTAGVVMIGGGQLTNGSATDARARILGGVSGLGEDSASENGTTITNFGTIEVVGSASYAISLRASPSALSLLRVEAGSTIIGAIYGGGGTLDLASGLGTITSVAVSTSGGGDIVATGASDPYHDFGTLEIGKAADFTLTGAGTIAAGGLASLDIEGVLGVTGSLSAAGAVKGGGTLAIESGETDFNLGASLSVAKVSVSGASALVDVATNLTYAGQWKQRGGTLMGSGNLEFTGAGDLFQNTTLDLAHTTINAASATLSGAIDLTGLLTVASPDLLVSDSPELTGGGTLELTGTATNMVIGASKGTLLTNVDDTIEGAGRLGAGSLRLTNEADGIIEGNTKAGLTIDTGASKIINAGLIEAYGVGHSLTITGAVASNGVLAAFGGALTVAGAVTGSGSVSIDKGGDAIFGSTFSQDVTFVASGTLTLADSQDFKGSISGFSKAGKTSLDLEDIAFGSHTKIFSSSTKAFSILTVTDGSHIAEIKLMGDYAGSSFAIASDGHGGTTVTDPPAVQAMASAMASFAPASSGSGAGSVPIQHPAATSLAKPPH